MYAPVRISINKLDVVPNRIVAGLVGVVRKGGGLGTGEWYIAVVFCDPLLHQVSRSSPYVDFVALAGNPVDNATLFSRVDGVLWDPKQVFRLEDLANALFFKASMERVRYSLEKVKRQWISTLPQALFLGLFLPL